MKTRTINAESAELAESLVLSFLRVLRVLRCLWCAGSAPVDRKLPPVASSKSPERAMLDQYCVTCHNQRAKTANLTLDTMDLAQLSTHADVWEKVVRKLRGGLMPPPGLPRPDPAAVTRFVSWLERSLDEAAAADPNPGRVALHRLNRTEYARAIEELLALRIDATAFLPQDDEADGFDNVASVLKVSPSFLDQYISAARIVSTRAIGSAAPRPASAVYRPARGTDQGLHVDGLPLGTRGGLLTEHLFPADGDYQLTITGLAGAGYVRGMEYRHTLVATIDGVKVFEGQIGGEEDLKAIDQKQAPAVAAINGRFQNIPVTVTAGPHTIGVTFVARSYAESDDVLYAFAPGGGEDRIPRVGSLEVVGPFNPSGISETPSRQRIFVCTPASADAELPCATKIFSTLARRAFRRPVTERDLEAPLAFYKSARAAGTFDVAIRDGLTTILASPKFLFRAERVPDNVAPGAIYRISDIDLASRLAFFLSGGLPDDQLLNLAEQRKLADPKVLEAEVRRLLAAPSSNALVTSFAFQWLRVRSIDNIDPDAIVFPNFDNGLRDAFKREIELFVQSVLREDRSVLDLLTADFTYRQRAAGAALRDSQYSRRAVSTRHPRRSESVGPARQGQRADGDLVPQSHRPGPARRLDSREPARHAAGRAAAGRRGLQGEQGRRESALGAGHHGTAPQQGVVQRLSRGDGSAGVFARELRRDRRVAYQRSLCRHRHRCVRAAGRRDAGQQPGRPPQGADAAPRAVRPDADREADDLCAGPQRRVLRHAGGARDRPRRRARQLPVLVDRDGYCEERAVPDAKGVGRGPKSEALSP